MPAPDATDRDVPRVRETYEEFTLDDRRHGLIADPERAHAWIQSDVVAEIRP